MLLAALILALQITTTSLPPATTGQPYAVTIQADSPVMLWFLWQYQGLPDGLGMNAESGLISGTPTAPGTYTISVFAMDPSGVQSAPQRFTLVVQ